MHLSVLMNDLLMCRPNLRTQLTELCLLTVFMFPFLKFLTWQVAYPAMRRVSKGGQERFAFYSQQSMKNGFFIDLSLENAFLVGVVLWAILGAHFIGGMLCVPSVFGWPHMTAEWASALARHGALSEAAWELQDFLKRGYQVLVLRNGDDGRSSPEAAALSKGSAATSSSIQVANRMGVLFCAKRKFKCAVHSVIAAQRFRSALRPKAGGAAGSVSPSATACVSSAAMEEPMINPVPLLVILAIHHAVGQLMIMPMNIYYPDNKLYHELVFLLLFAAFICMSLSQLSYTIDTRTVAGLACMLLCTAVSWVVIMYGRCIRFGYVVYLLLLQLYADGAYYVVGFGSVGVVLMSVFNLLMIVDATAKLVKFSKKLGSALVYGLLKNADKEA